MKTKELTNKERVKNGEILIHAVIEILGAPKDHIEKTMIKVVDHVGTQTGLTIISEQIAEAQEQNELFSTFADLQIWAKSFGHLVEFLFNYMPSSIEVLEPQEVSLKRIDLGNLMTELAGRLHASETTIKDLRARNQVIDHNTRMIIQNFITRGLEQNAQTSTDLALFTGVPERNVLAFLDHLKQEGIIEQKNEQYSISPKTRPVVKKQSLESNPQEKKTKDQTQTHKNSKKKKK